MSQVYVSIGSNINKEHNIQAGINALTAVFEKVVCSSIYESESVGFNGDNFYNMVIGFSTEEPPHQISKRLKQIEDDNGRDRNGPRFSSRTLDIDLLLYDDLIIDDGTIAIPRDEITKNAFVLWPLAEIAPKRTHPLLNKTYEILWNDFDKSSQPLWVAENSAEIIANVSL